MSISKKYYLLVASASLMAILFISVISIKTGVIENPTGISAIDSKNSRTDCPKQRPYSLTPRKALVDENIKKSCVTDLDCSDIQEMTDYTTPEGKTGTCYKGSQLPTLN